MTTAFSQCCDICSISTSSLTCYAEPRYCYWVAGRKSDCDCVPMGSLPPLITYPLQQCQCCTGHTFIGKCYHSFLPSQDLPSPCRAIMQTQAHTLHDCPLFDDAHFLLNDLYPSLPLTTLLGTPDGIHMLTNFIKCSGAFKKC